MNKQAWIVTALVAAAAAAQAEGPIDYPKDEPVSAVPLLTREQVRAEMLAARERGETAALTGEDSGSAYLAKLDRQAVEEQQRLALLRPVGR